MSTPEDEFFDRLCRTEYSIAYKLATEKYLDIMFTVTDIDNVVDQYMRPHGWTLIDLFEESKRRKNNGNN